MTLAEVHLWGRSIGAVSWEKGGDYAAFQYDAAFARSGIQVSPLMMPLSERVYTFPALARETFHGLPGLLADSLPDKFGNALIDAWLATQGRTPESFNPVERLCYIGSRGMGALEFLPSVGPRMRSVGKIEMEALVQLASEVLSRQNQWQVNFSKADRQKALKDILRVGTSAGGARAKAVIAWNRETNEVRSGQVRAGDGFEYWLLKFDGVTGNKDREENDPSGYGAIEYAYYLMAKGAGVLMSESRLFEEGGRRHFMTKRFDRFPGGEKKHMQSLGAMAHFDFNQPRAYSYEQAFLVMRRLDLSMGEIEQQFRRMVFHIVARNQDDHVKNIAFLMDKTGKWSLAPAFDVIYSYNPKGAWTSSHQMTMNGKAVFFLREDFRACAQNIMMKRGRADQILEEVLVSVKKWREYAEKAGVRESWREQIQESLRLDW